MKRKIFVFTALILTLSMALIATACVGSWQKSQPLKDYDFSVDNIVEVRISSSPMYINLHGTIYGVKKGDSQEGDEAINAISTAWSSLQRDAVFKKAKKYDGITTGGTYYYECIFADGSSIKLTRDRVKNLYFNDGSSVRVDDEDMLAQFHNTFEQIMDKQNIVGHISQNHDDNCDCDKSTAQE
ncbi:MAG: hypothetical protein K2I23_00040 [Clostridia bacterium]|nr:hypothetical protein [Clostridia bacterium]